MKTRSADKKKSVNRDRGSSSTDPVDASTSFDENLWGTLQHHLCLAENVFSKLPFEEFFNLRSVCKDWYNLACKRLALKERIHKPFFTLLTKGAPGRLDGILIYSPRFKSWVWKMGWTHETLCQVVSTEGVVYCSGDKYVATPREANNSAGAFDWKYRFYTKLLAPPVPQNDQDKTILGITSIDSGREFKVVRASQAFDTQVYDSKTRAWQTKPCRPKPETRGDMQSSIGCAHCNGRMYITTEHKREIFVYDFEKASWSSLKSPCKWISKQRQHYCLDTLGAWNGRVFDVAEDSKPASYVQGSLCVWELIDEAMHEWKVYDRFPKDLYSWLRSDQGFRPLRTKAGDVTIQASFCGDYMVVYSWYFKGGSAGRFCLFNMATKNWQKLEVPVGRVAIREFSDSDDSDDDDSLDDSDEEAFWELERQFANESSFDEFMDDHDLGSDSDSGSGSDFF